MDNHSETITDDWQNCYGESWTGGIICPEAFSHPAKYARGLIRHIYQHAVDEGWLQPGDTVLDPFSGVSLGAWASLQHGINFVGIELERPFHDLSTGVDCTGISKVDWVRFYGRADKARYLEDRHWCPRCMAQVGIISPPKSSQLEMFPDVSTASYRRNSGIIPHTEPHHYVGNLELFARHSRNGAQAVCLLGDSRKLAEVLGGAGLSGCISSPPYISGGHHDGVFNTWGGQAEKQGGCASWATKEGGYGFHPAQLGNMREGEFADAVISSPAYVRGCQHTGGDDLHPEHVQGGPVHHVDYGSAPGQLAAMPAGDAPAACISSPPYAGSIQEGKSGIDWGKQADRETDHSHGYDGEGYGSTPGNLAQLPEGDAPAACISSPPYEGSQVAQQRGDCGGSFEKTGQGGSANRNETTLNYIGSEGQIGAESGPTFWSAARAIVQQAYDVLAPGGHAIWIVKAFVRNKAIVDFPGQWRDLCESVGFVTLHRHRAHLIEDRGTQAALIGEDDHRIRKHFSFFRRLHSQKYPHLEIKWEIVLCQQKP